MILGLEEKPQLTFPVYAGVVVLEPPALNYIKDGEFFHMPDLFMRLKEQGEKVVAYRHRGNWVDIGQDIEQYLKVNQEIMQGDLKFSPALSRIIFEKPPEVSE